MGRRAPRVYHKFSCNNCGEVYTPEHPPSDSWTYYLDTLVTRDGCALCGCKTIRYSMGHKVKPI